MRFDSTTVCTSLVCLFMPAYKESKTTDKQVVRRPKKKYSIGISSNVCKEHLHAWQFDNSP